MCTTNVFGLLVVSQRALNTFIDDLFSFIVR